MKITISFLAFLTMIGCSNPKEHSLDFNFNDSAFIKLTVLNCSDTFEFSYKTTPMIPRGCVIKHIKITHDTVYYFAHRTIKPDYIDLTLKKRFQTYVIPGDTLSITANLDSNITDNDAITIDGDFSKIMNFFSKKHEKLGYWNINNALVNYSDISYPIEKAFSLGDSICDSELEFLSTYYTKNGLPYWFYETMKKDIEYNKVLIRPQFIYFRKHFFKENVINPEAYYIFDQISLLNSKAKFSESYYHCVDIYLWINRQQDLEGKRGIDRGLPLFERSIPEANEILKGEILEHYLAWKISESFAVCKNLNELTRVDSLYISLKTNIKNEEIIRIINNQRDYMAEYYEGLKNNPFSFTKIIPIDN